MSFQSDHRIRAHYQGIGAAVGGGGAGVNEPNQLAGLPIVIDPTVPPSHGQTLTFDATTQQWGTGTITGLSPINSGYIMANATGASAVPVGVSLTSYLDFVFGTAQGAILYRSAAAWVVLAPGTSGQVLQSGGPAADVSWATASSSGGAMLPLVTGDTPGPAFITDDVGQCIGVAL